MEHPSSNKPDSYPKRRDAHDWVTLGVLTLTLIAASGAATFTGIQAYIARDQERRALRAYVVAEPALKGSFAEPETVFAGVNSENMGQTPVYDLVTLIQTEAAAFNDQLSSPDMMSIDCRSVLSQEGAQRGVTFSKLHHSQLYGLSLEGSGRAGLQRGDFALYVYGTICYRDIFQTPHYVQVCFYWYSDQQGPEICPYQDIKSD